MPAGQPDFKESYKTANAALDVAEKNADAAMNDLSKDVKEKMRKMYETEKLMNKKAEEIIEMLKKNGDDWEQMDKSKFVDVCDAFLPELLGNIPPIFTEKFVKKILSDGVCKKDKFHIYFLLSRIIQILGESYSKNAEEEYEKSGKQEPIQPLTLSFSEQDFVVPPNIGIRNPKHVSIVFNGDVGRNVGYNMVGGNITINGNTSQAVGNSMFGGNIVLNGNAHLLTGVNMQGGTLSITGTSGILTGYKMTGGTLSIGGKVESFDESAFTPDNQGTIIWKGVTLWNNGWTPEGLKMKNEGKIPGISADS